jgi:hypothetical protein
MHHIIRPLTASKRAVPNSPEDIARACLATAGNNPERAIALASGYAHGARLRATIAAIGSALLRASAN